MTNQSFSSDYHAYLNRWRVGARVARNIGQFGTIMQVSGQIKVKWDNGQTSYYRYGKGSSVKLASQDEE